MTELLIALGAFGIFAVSGYFLTKWEKVVFPGNQQNGESKPNQK